MLKLSTDKDVKRERGREGERGRKARRGARIDLHVQFLKKKLGTRSPVGKGARAATDFIISVCRVADLGSQ